MNILGVEIKEPRDQRILNIIGTVAQEMGIQPEDILKHDNSAVLMTARRRIAKELKAKGYSYPEIGRLMDRHQTSIQNMVKGKGYADRGR